MNHVCKESGHKKRHDIHDPERKTRLEHRAHFLRIISQLIILAATPVPERPQRGQEVAAPFRLVEAPAGSLRYVAQLVNGRDQGAEEAEVNERNEDCGALGCGVAD